MKAVSTSTLGMSGLRSTAKPACSTLPCAGGHGADLGAARRRQLEAVVDLGGGAHVQQRALHACQSLSSTLTPPTGRPGFPCWPASARRAGGAAPDSANTLAPRRRGGEGVGMDADEQVGLHAPRLAHARGQGHEEVGVAREKARMGLPPTLAALMRSRSLSAICSTTSFRACRWGRWRRGLRRRGRGRWRR
jgi:hypothetical protein